MSIASAKQLGDHSQQKMKPNLSTSLRTKQFTEQSNFTHKLAAAARLTLCWKYTKLVGTLLSIGISGWYFDISTDLNCRRMQN